MHSPQVYSTLLLWLLSELFERLPEVGDLPKPKLVFFFDEAHLLFTDAPPALLTKIEQVVRLIRCKGVGVYFVTQNPIDIPDTVLGQLGNKVQHALRAFTPREQKAVEAMAETFRRTRRGRRDAVTELAVGEALLSVLQATERPRRGARLRRAAARPHRRHRARAAAAGHHRVARRRPLRAGARPRVGRGGPEGARRTAAMAASELAAAATAAATGRGRPEARPAPAVGAGRAASRDERQHGRGARQERPSVAAEPRGPLDRARHPWGPDDATTVRCPPEISISSVPSALRRSCMATMATSGLAGTSRSHARLYWSQYGSRLLSASQ